MSRKNSSKEVAIIKIEKKLKNIERGKFSVTRRDLAKLKLDLETLKFELAYGA